MKGMMAYWVAAVITLTGLAAQAEVRLAKVFSDHMVLQRDRAVCVWGWAEAGESVTVTFAGQSKTAQAEASGKWRVKLDPLPASAEPRELVVSSARPSRLTLHDVLVGDVWLCSGQSNMEFTLGNADNKTEALAAATNRLVRMINVKPSTQVVPADDIQPTAWLVSSPDKASAFSAVGYFFGLKLQQETGIPIGLINNAWGGTRIEQWTPWAELAAYPELAAVRSAFTNSVVAYYTRLGELVEPMRRLVEQAARAPDYGATLPTLPDVPLHPVLNGMSGIYNGRVAPLTPFAIKGAIWYQGEANGGDDDIYVAKMRCLIGSWRKAWGEGDFPFYYVQLANIQAANPNPAGGDGWAKIRMAQLKSLAIPKTGMALAIDIGEANDIHPRNKEDVGQRLALWALKQDYGQGDRVCSGPLFKGIAVENGAIRVRFDSVGSGLMAGKKVGHGPAVEAAGQALKGFAVASTNKVWRWAEAVIEGDAVVVSSKDVSAPVAVRYAYSMNPEGCNLYNRDGLPASPFRSDDW